MQFYAKQNADRTNFLFILIYHTDAQATNIALLRSFLHVVSNSNHDKIFIENVFLHSSFPALTHEANNITLLWSSFVCDSCETKSLSKYIFFIPYIIMSARLVLVKGNGLPKLSAGCESQKGYSLNQEIASSYLLAMTFVYFLFGQLFSIFHLCQSVSFVANLCSDNCK